MIEPVMITNLTCDELAIGDSASMARVLGQRDIELFALASGDVNPAHLDPEFAATDMFHHVIAHGLWGGGLISAVLGTQMPGPGTIYLDQSLTFKRPVALGDTITATVTVTEKAATRRRVTFDCRCTNQAGEDVITGIAHVIAPDEKIRRPRIILPDIRFAAHAGHARLMAAAQGGGPTLTAPILTAPILTAVAHPCSAAAITAVAEAEEAGLITPILVGPLAKLAAAIAEAGKAIADFRCIDAPHSHAAAGAAVALVRRGEAQLLMKGSAHTDELMEAVVAHDTGLRTARRISHAYVMDAPGHAWPLIITDAAINIAPSLCEKADIIQNAIDLAHVIGIANPKVAILAAVETVNPAMTATLDAAALCKMAERGHITGGTLDGPLAFDNAISEAAAREKGIVSPVAGQAQILVVPNIEAGNMLAKQLTFLGGADAAGIVLGASVPIILTSRADSIRTRLASCALAVLMARAQ